MKPKERILVALLTSALWSAPALAASKDCEPMEEATGVFGDDWMFASLPPKGWIGTCETGSAASILLWPKKSGTKGGVFLYVTVSGMNKSNNTIEKFIREEQNKFRKGASDAQAQQLATITDKRGLERRVFKLTAPSLRQYEYVAYVQGQNAWFTVVLTTPSREKQLQHRKDFETYLNTFIPFTKKKSRT
jgi:hypothetical protein